MIVNAIAVNSKSLTTNVNRNSTLQNGWNPLTFPDLRLVHTVRSWDPIFSLALFQLKEMLIRVNNFFEFEQKSNPKIVSYEPDSRLNKVKVQDCLERSWSMLPRELSNFGSSCWLKLNFIQRNSLASL